MLNNTQTTSWQEFATGEYAFAENGTWQLGNAKKAGFEYGVLPIPGRTGGTAPAPTGGEFVTVPVQDDKGTETKAGTEIWKYDRHDPISSRFGRIELRFENGVYKDMKKSTLSD